MASSGRINGDIFAFKYNNHLLAASKDLGHSIGVDQRETTTRDDQGRYQGEPTKVKETIKGGFLVALDNNCYQTIKSLARSRTKFTYFFGSTVSGDQYEQGTGFFINVDTSAPDNDNVTGSFSVQIVGVPQIFTNP